MPDDNHPPADPPVRSSEWLGAAYYGSDGAVTCGLCHSECEWEQCGECGGEGGSDGYEEDPLWYQPGELAPCGGCSSTGGHYWCPNKECDNGLIVEIRRKAPND